MEPFHLCLAIQSESSIALRLYPINFDQIFTMLVTEIQRLQIVRQ